LMSCNRISNPFCFRYYCPDPGMQSRSTCPPGFECSGGASIVACNSG
jgi:hypothetical protein